MYQHLLVRSAAVLGQFRVDTFFENMGEYLKSGGIAFLGVLGILLIIWAGIKIFQAVTSGQKRKENLAVFVAALIVGALLLGTSAWTFFENAGQGMSDSLIEWGS